MIDYNYAYRHSGVRLPLCRRGIDFLLHEAYIIVAILISQFLFPYWKLRKGEGGHHGWRINWVEAESVWRLMSMISARAAMATGRGGSGVE